MLKKRQVKSFICMFITFLMVFTSADTGILGMKQVFAETIKEDSKSLHDESVEKSNASIGVQGLKDGEEFTSSYIGFLAWANNASDEDFIVKLNDEILEHSDFRKQLYEGTLKPGKNIVTIEAKDDNGNVAKEIYTVTYKLEEPKDTEKQVIEVEGLENGQKVSNKEVSFKVTVIDNVDKDIKPIVKLNNEVVTETNGEYKVTLIDGENIITIEATDAAGNKADETYPLTYIKLVDKDKLRKQVEEAIEKASKVVENNSDWGVIGLARAGKTDAIASDYLEKTEKYLKTPQNQGTFISKPTELERITLGVLAAGGDPTNIAGYNLIKQIYSADLGSQGINATAFGLISLDAGEYYVPSDTKWTRDKLIADILSDQCDDGGWSWGFDEADPDMTGMVMTALAPYNNDKYTEVQNAIQRAVECLSSIQKDSGAYISWGKENAESCAQVIMGLCTNGIDPTGERFTKNGKNVVDALLTFEVDGGGFDHLLEERKHVNPMATEQALYALDQYIFFEDKKGSIYQWGKQDTSGDKTVNVRIEGKDKVIVPNTDFLVRGDNATVKDIVKQVLNSKGITYKENSIGFNTINNQIANEVNNEKWLCSIENSSKIENMSSRYVNNYENIIVYLGKNSKDFTYTWVECSEASVFKRQQIEVFTNSDVDLNVKGCKNNNYCMIDNITGATVYVNGQQYEKDGKNVVTDDSGKVTFNFDKPGNYEITTQKDNMRSGNFLIKVVEDIEPPTVEFWPENIEERIEKDKVEQIAITPEDNKDDSKDVKIFVKLNGKELKPDKIRSWNGGLEFNDVVFDKYDNLFEVTVTDNVDKDIKPIVKLNNEIVTGTNGEYKVTLTDGENIITIEATDVAGNKADETYKVIYKAEDTTIKEPFKIKVRVEANDHTIVKPVEVTVDDLDLSKYGIKTKFTEPKPIHAIIKALESVGIDCTDSQKGLNHGGGDYITIIDGLKTLSTGKNDGWMYYVDNKFANEGIGAFKILDAKSIVVFFQEDYTKNTYSWFDKEEVTVKTGNNVKLKLTGNFYDMWTDETKTGAVDGATILVNNKEYKLNDEIVKTDVDGKVSLTFNEPGTYHISAEKKDFKTGKRILTRPYCRVIVEEGEEQPEKPEQPEKFVAKRIGKGSLNKGSSAEVEFKMKNKLEKDTEVTLAVVLYDKKTNEMINYSYVRKVLKEGEIESFAGGFTIPEKGDYVVKAIICDSLDKKEGKMNILVDPVKIPVE